MLYQAWRNIFFLRGLAQCSLMSITDWSSESENTAPYWTNEVPWNQFYFNFKLRRLFLRQTLLQWLQNTFLKNQSRKISLRILSSSRDFTSNRYPFVHDWKWLEMISNVRDSFSSIYSLNQCWISMHNTPEIRKKIKYFTRHITKECDHHWKKLMAAYLEIINGYWEATV